MLIMDYSLKGMLTELSAALDVWDKYSDTCEGKCENCIYAGDLVTLFCEDKGICIAADLCTFLNSIWVHLNPMMRPKELKEDV